MLEFQGGSAGLLKASCWLLVGNEGVERGRTWTTVGFVPSLRVCNEGDAELVNAQLWLETHGNVTSGPDILDDIAEVP